MKTFMATPPYMNAEQVKFAAYLILVAGFEALQSNLDSLREDQQPSIDTIAETITDTVISQTGHGLSIIYYKTTGEGMGVCDAMMLKVNHLNHDLETVMRDFAQLQITEGNAKRPNIEFIAQQWTEQAFN